MTRQIDRKPRASWRRRIERQQRGSLTVAQSCEREKVSTANFRGWKRKLQAGDAGQASSTSTRRARSGARTAPAASGTGDQDRPFVQVPLTRYLCNGRIPIDNSPTEQDLPPPYIRYGADQEELYDTTKDPREWANQINNPDYRPIIKTTRLEIPSSTELATSLPEVMYACGRN